MSFMQPYTLLCDWWELDLDDGITFLPADMFDLDYIREVYGSVALTRVEKRENKWGARLSAPGYLDCTDWTLHDTEQEALNYLEEMYGDDYT